MTEAGPPFRLWWDEGEEIARCVWSAGTTCRLEDAQAITAAVVALDRPSLPLLVSGLSKLDRPAREYLVHDVGHVCAVALLADTAVAKMIANFFIGVGRPAVPVRLFTDDVSAVRWLREQH